MDDDTDSKKDESFHSLLLEVQKFLHTYQTNATSNSSWMKFYVDRLGMKLVAINYQEPQPKFIKKIEYIYDMMLMSYYVVKVVNPEKFSQKDFHTTSLQKRRVVDELTKLSKDEWSLFLDQLKGSQFGLN